MELPTPAVRYLGAEDRTALGAFRCSAGEWFEDEVEHHIRHRLLDVHAHRAAHTDHRVMGLELPRVGLVAIAAHEEDLTRDGEQDLVSTLWTVAAVTMELRGAELPEVDLGEGRPVTLGRYLAAATLSDALDATSRAPVVRANVARGNARSLALCRRVGLTQELPYEDPRYVSLLGTY